MTKEQAIAELTRAADLCPTTPLAEACRMAVEVLRSDGEKPDCGNCRHSERMPGVYPCNKCVTGVDSDRPSKWEPKEVDNGQND